LAVVFGFDVGGVRRRLFPGPAEAKIQSIAVLPLANLSGDPEQEYFSDGMTDELITDLAQLGSVRVISRTSTNRYKQAQKPLPEIANELNVDAIVEGSVQSSAGRIHVTAQLVQAHPEKHIWAESYDRPLGDAVTVQEELALAIAGAIHASITPQQQAHLEQKRTVSPEAHDAYFKGRYFWNKRTREGLNKALDYFDQAIAADRNYAPAYVGVADSYTMLADYDWLPPSEAALKAKAAVTQALAIDDQLAEAHASLADIRRFYDWDWAGAEQEYKRAIELNPNYATAHQWYAEYLSAMGRHQQAIREMERAQELDPLSVVVKSANGWVLLFAREYDKAIAQCQQVIEMDPSFGEVYSQLRRAYEQKGMYAEALAADEKLRAFKRKGGDPTGRRLEARPISGAKAYWQKMHELTETDLRNNEEAARFRMAEIYAQLGEKDQALQWLERSYQEHSFWMPFIGVHPHLDPLRSDPRFSDLMRRMNLTS
jgi:TolB-like protein